MPRDGGLGIKSNGRLLRGLILLMKTIHQFSGWVSWIEGGLGHQETFSQFVEGSKISLNGVDLNLKVNVRQIPSQKQACWRQVLKNI